MQRAICWVAAMAVGAVAFSGAAMAEKFHYPTSDGGCATGDTNSLSGGPYNHGNFFPAGGWGPCLHVANSGNLAHSVLRDPHTGDVMGTTSMPVPAKAVGGARAVKAGEGGSDCKPDQDKGCVLRPSQPKP